MKNENISLFDKVCTCGKIYAETCNIRADKCPEFIRHRETVIKNFNQKFNLKTK